MDEIYDAERLKMPVVSALHLGSNIEQRRRIEEYVLSEDKILVLLRCDSVRDLFATTIKLFEGYGLRIENNMRSTCSQKTTLHRRGLLHLNLMWNYVLEVHGSSKTNDRDSTIA